MRGDKRVDDEVGSEWLKKHLEHGVYSTLEVTSDIAEMQSPSRKIRENADTRVFSNILYRLMSSFCVCYNLTRWADRSMLGGMRHHANVSRLSWQILDRYASVMRPSLLETHNVKCAA